MKKLRHLKELTMHVTRLEAVSGFSGVLVVQAILKP